MYGACSIGAMSPGLMCEMISPLVHERDAIRRNWSAEMT